jgi:hypothetical protein
MDASLGYARGMDALWGTYQWLDPAPKERNESGRAVAGGVVVAVGSILNPDKLADIAREESR